MERHKSWSVEAESQLRAIIRAQNAEIEELRVRLRDLRAEMAQKEEEPPAEVVRISDRRRPL